MPTVNRPSQEATIPDVPRREFLLASGALVSGAFLGAQQARPSDAPWYTRARRCGHSNFVENDPQVFNIDEWVDYWSSLKVDAVTLSAGGMMAFYPTKIPLHHKSKFLGDRDLFGDFAKALKKKGIRVIARIDPKSNYGDAVRAHPEWFQRTADGHFRLRDEQGEEGAPPRDEWIYWTCMFSDYFTEFIPRVMREVNSLYEIDAFFGPSWPGQGRCYCEVCKRVGKLDSGAYRERHMVRILEIIRLWDSIAQEKRPDNLYLVSCGGWLQTTMDLTRIAKVVRWMYSDHQGRPDHQGEGDDALPVWHFAQQARVCHSAMKGRPTSLNPAENSHARLLWRETSCSAAEITIGLAQATAAGSIPFYTWLGGAPEDRRWQQPGRMFYQWHARHEAHFANKRPITNLGLIWSQRTTDLYKPPQRTTDLYKPPTSSIKVTDYMQGMYYALLEGRFVFRVIHENDLGPESLKPYSALILPNVAVLTDEQVGQLRNYVQSGGSLLATFETGLFDGQGKQRSEFALADVFGIQKAGDRQGSMGGGHHCPYARIERDHPILAGFRDTKLLPGPEFRIPLRAGNTDPVLTVVPPYPGHPPEFVYPRTPRTDEPAVVLGEKGRSRLVYFSGDIDRSLWRSGDTDLSDLLQNSIRWMTRNQSPVSVTGDGIAEIFAWETEPGFAVHILNYNNPNMTYGWFRRNYPIGQQRVRMLLPKGVHISKAQLLRAESDLPFEQNGPTVEFMIPRVDDYEVAALYAAGRS